MKVFKRMGCVLLASMMVIGLTGCGDSNKSKQEEKVKESSKDMVYVGSKKADGKEEHYFIDGNAKVKKYSGYTEMEDFINGISIVEVESEEFNGNMLIDTNENVIAKYKKIEKSDYDIPFYKVINEQEQKGIYSAQGEKIAECQYSDIFIEDLDIAGSEHVIVAKKEDTSIDIYGENGTFICSVPAGYAKEGYGYDGVNVEGYQGDKVLKVEYGNVKKLFSIELAKELSAEEYKDYKDGIALTDGKLIFYNDNFEVVKEIDCLEENKSYKNALGYGEQFYYASYDTKESVIKDMHDIYNKNGELIYTALSNKIDLWEQDGNEYLLCKTDDGKVLINSDGEQKFSVDSETEILKSTVNGIFYTKNEEGVRIYKSDTMEVYNDEVYEYSYEGVAFKKGDYLVFNKEGQTCTLKKEDDVQLTGVQFLLNGYVAFNVMKGNEWCKYILDVSGKGDVVEIPYEASFSEIVPCYSVGKVYYDYDGNVIIDANTF